MEGGYDVQGESLHGEQEMPGERGCDMTAPVRIPKKLTEVALPLKGLNAAAKREKSIRHGHPSTLHLWWARRRGRMEIPDERCACLLREPERDVEGHPARMELVVG